MDEDFTEECKYGMLENECNSAFRECIKSIALKNGIQTETERTHTKRRRLGSRQILRLLYDSLATAPHDTGDSTFKIIDFVKVVSTGSGMVSSRRGLEAFCDKRNHVLASISVDRPADHMMLSSLFYEQVRELRCLELDMQLWDRDTSVRNYVYLRSIGSNSTTRWHRRRNQEKVYSATRSSSGRRQHGSPRRTGSG